jgi:hypothetical protein
MATILEHRFGPDRRQKPRGGRRPEDMEGFAPLVLLVDEGAGAVHRAEAILAKLRFAVTTSANVDDALKVVSQLRPDLVVATEDHAKRIRTEAPQHVPVVEMDAELQASPELLVEEIRRAIRANRPPLAMRRNSRTA